MTRRELLMLLCGAAIAGPRLASAQTVTKVHRLGLLNKASPVSVTSPFGAALIRGLASRGYTLGGNLVIERRGAEGDQQRLPHLVDELVASKVDVILALSYPAALAAKTRATLPIVVYSAGDPVGTGLIDSLARPGGHLTGISDMTIELSPKRLQLLKELVPNLRRVAMIWNADDVGMTLRYQASQAAAQVLGMSVEPLAVREPKDFETVLAAIAGSKCDAIFVVSDGLTNTHRRRVLDFAAERRLPVIYEDSEFITREGALMFYGPDLEESIERIAALIDRILKGSIPKDLPFEKPTRFRFAINMKTAKALDLTVPPTLLALADEVIE